LRIACWYESSVSSSVTRAILNYLQKQNAEPLKEATSLNEKQEAFLLENGIKNGTYSPSVEKEEAKATADKKAQEILVDSMKHGALNYIAEYTVSAVKISDEEVKGLNKYGSGIHHRSISVHARTVLFHRFGLRKIP
jgi:hypothetical protein